MVKVCCKESVPLHAVATCTLHVPAVETCAKHVPPAVSTCIVHAVCVPACLLHCSGADARISGAPLGLPAAASLSSSDPYEPQRVRLIGHAAEFKINWGAKQVRGGKGGGGHQAGAGREGERGAKQVRGEGGGGGRQFCFCGGGWVEVAVGMTLAKKKKNAEA